jgi:hypothetical protein
MGSGLRVAYLERLVAFFAAEAKASTIAVPLEGQLPQILLELVAMCETFWVRKDLYLILAAYSFV